MNKSELDVNTSEQGSKPPAESINQWELSMGMKWFSRLGVVALLIGFVMALKYSFELLQLPPEVIAFVKVAAGFVSAGGLFFAGTHLFNQHRDKFTILGRVLQSGGLVLGYLSLYGMFFIPEVQLVHTHNLAIGWPLLIAYVGLMIALARRFESRTMALLSLTFGYYTASFSGSQIQAFATAGVLAVASVLLSTYRENWRMISAAGMVGTLMTFFYWNLLAPDNATAFGVYEEQRVFLWFHFIVFHLGNILPSRNASGVLNVVNSFLFYTLYQFVHDQDWPAGLFEAAIALFHLGSYGYTLLVNRQRGGENKLDSFYEQTNLILGLVFSGLATLKHFESDSQSVVLAAEALALGLLVGRARYSRIYQYAAYGFWISAYASLFLMSWSTMPALPLVLTVGAVSLVGLFLEQRVVSPNVGANDVLIVRIPLMAICSLTFFGALITGLESEWYTVSFLLTAAALMATGFIGGLKSYRWNGLFWLLAALIHLVVIDIATLETVYKILAFLALGVVLLGGSFAYHLINSRMMPLTGSADPKNTANNEIKLNQENG